MLTYYYQRIYKSLDNIIENADSVLAKAKAGDKIVLGGAADSSRDEEAVLVFNTSYSMQIDAELMKQMVTQKMQLNPKLYYLYSKYFPNGIHK